MILKDGVLGKPRPRFTYKNGKRYAYTPKKFQDCESKIGYEYERQGGPFYGTGEVSVSIIVCRRQPKGTPKRIYEIPDTVRPDLDNIAKIVLDALNGIAYTDDCQVTSIQIDKQPRRKLRYECLFITVNPVSTHGKRRKLWNALKDMFLEFADKEDNRE